VILSGGDELLRPAHLPPEVRLASPAGAAAPAGRARSLADAEREAVQAALEATGGRRNAAARLLGVSTVDAAGQDPQVRTDPGQGRPPGLT